MEIQKTQSPAPLEERVNALQALFSDQKAQDVVCIDISRQSGGGIADRLFVLTAVSPRHARAISDAISALCHEHGYEYLRVEGYQVGEWVLVDLNDIIVSIFLENTRALYRLEDLWKQLPRDNQ